MAPLVLNVDDFEPLRYARSATLRAAGFEVVEAGNGADALSIARERRPDIVVLDVHMPGLDGLEVCRQLRADPATAAILVLHVSATFRDSETRVRALENGADGYLAEPVEPEELLAQVRSLLRLAAAEAEAKKGKRAEEALRESEARYRSLFEAIDEAFCLVEVLLDDEGHVFDYRFIEANPAFMKHTGLGNPVGRTMRELLPQIEPTTSVGRVALTREPLRFEHDAPAIGRCFDLYVFPVGAPEDRRIAALFRDITSRRQAEKVLRESEEWMRLAAEAGRIGTWDLDHATGRLRLGGLYHELAGIDADQWEGTLEAFFRRVSQEDRARIQDVLAEAFAGRKPYFSVGFRFVLAGGGVRWMQAHGRVFYGPSGLPTRTIGAIADVSPLKRVEESLSAALADVRERESEIESIYDSAPVGLCVVDREGHYLRVNRRLAEMNRRTPEAHVGLHLRDLLGENAAQVEPVLRKVVETGEAVQGVEVTAEHPDQPGVTGTWIENWHPIKDHTGAVTAVNVGVQDVTRLKLIEDELRRANQVKEEFLATLSHELRSPLNAILGWSQLLRKGRLNGTAVQEGLDAIVRNAEAQRQLLADVLDVSRMDTGKLRLELAEVDLAETVRLAVASMQPAAERNGVALELSCEVGEAVAKADVARVEQIAWNLLSNAIKFTPSGGSVQIGFRETGTDYELSVRDSGVGIRPDFLPHVFDRFTQADPSMSRRHGGLGLGLSIVRQLVELHGGRVRAASDGEGRGAVFTVTFPIPANRPVRMRAPADLARLSLTRGPSSGLALRGLRVLVLDDVDDARLLTRTIIEGAGGEVAVAASAGDALSRLCGEGTRQPDLILADLAMPGMDGYEFLRRLRALPNPAAAAIPVVAVTAHGSDADRARALAAGFSRHLAKPFAEQDLLDVVRQCADESVR